MPSLVERFSLKARKWLRNDAEFLKQQHSFFLFSLFPFPSLFFSSSSIFLLSFNLIPQLKLKELKKRFQKKKREVSLHLTRLWMIELAAGRMKLGIVSFSLSRKRKEKNAPLWLKRFIDYQIDCRFQIEGLISWIWFNEVWIWRHSN